MTKRMLASRDAGGAVAALVVGNENLQKDIAASMKGDKAFREYVDKTYKSDGDFWKIVTDEKGNVIDVKDDGDYDNFNVYDKNGKKIRSVKKDSTSFVQQVINAAGSKQKWDDVNHAMATEYGLSYADGRGWYAIDERGVDKAIRNTSPALPDSSIAQHSIVDSITNAYNGVKENLTSKVSDIRTGVKSLTDKVKGMIYGKNDNVVPNGITEKEAKTYKDTIIKQKEIEQRFGYDNALCYGTSVINLYRLVSGMTDQQVNDYFSGDEVNKYISKPDCYTIFDKLSNSVSAFLGNDKYYDYVYQEEKGWQILRYGSAEDFQQSSYKYGIGYYYTGTNYSGKANHYELIVNNPYTVHNPGQQEYNLGWIYPVNQISIRKDWLK